jgi:hypothetical protein
MYLYVLNIVLLCELESHVSSDVVEESSTQPQTHKTTWTSQCYRTISVLHPSTNFATYLNRNIVHYQSRRTASISLSV